MILGTSTEDDVVEDWRVVDVVIGNKCKSVGSASNHLSSLETMTGEKVLIFLFRRRAGLGF